MVDNATTETNQNHHHQVGDISSEMLPESDSGSQSKQILSTEFDSMVDNAATATNQNHHHQVRDISGEMLPQSGSRSQSKHTLSTDFDSMVDNSATETNQNNHHQVRDISGEMLPQSGSGSQSKQTLSTDFDSMVDNTATETNQNHHHQVRDSSSEKLPQSGSRSQSKHTLSTDFDSMVDDATTENNKNHHHQVGDISNKMLAQYDFGSQSKHTLSIDFDSGALKTVDNAATENNQNHQAGDISIEMLLQSDSGCLDDNKRPPRTVDRSGTLWTASALIITAMIGSGGLSLAWDIAQLGWIAGPAVMFLCSFVGYYTSCLLSDCYRTGDPDLGERNPTYMDSVRSILGGVNVKACGFIQYLNLFATAIDIMISASYSMMAIKYTNCFHESNGENSCYILSNPYIIIFGITEILLSQIPDFNQIWWVSIAAVVMFFTSTLIGLGLGMAQVAAHRSLDGSLKGISIKAVTKTQKMWRSFEAFKDIASAYSFSGILIEIQDTIRSPPSEAKTMKKATRQSTAVLTTIYTLGGCMGYAALGDATPKNLLTDFAFYKPFWLLDIANAAIVINLVGAYQVFSQPMFAFVEKQAAQRWPGSEFITKERKILVPGLGQYKMNLFRLVWRTVFVIATTVISMLFPFFYDVVEITTLGFWPLTVYFPVQMYIKQKKIPKRSTRWVYLQMLNMACLVISIVAAAASIAGLKDNLKTYRPFGTSY